MSRMRDFARSAERDFVRTTSSTNSLSSTVNTSGAYFGKSFDGDLLGAPDGVGDKGDITYGVVELPVPILDNVADDTSTTHSITVGGAHFISTINTPGDFDFYKVQLQAGVTYELAVYGTQSGLSGVPLADAMVEIYDAQGKLITSTDGGSPNDSLGLDARLTFTATKSGTYYVNARAFDQDSTDGDKGELVGDYEVFARVSD